MLATYRGLRFAVLGLCAGICLGSEPVLLELRLSRDGQLSGGESHEYRFVLNSGQYARFLVDQRSVNVAVEVCDPSGKSVYAADSYQAGDAEVLQFVAENSGIHRLRLFAPARTAPLGLYSITLDEIVPATERHRHLAAGALAYARAMASATEGSKASLASASKSFDEAITHWQAAQDVVAEARTLTTLGLHYGQMGERRKAIEFTGRALTVAKASENSQAEAWALTGDGIAQVQYGGDRRIAADELSRARHMMDAAGDQLGLATADLYLGRIAVETGDLRKGLEYFRQSVNRYRQLNAQEDAMTAVNNMGFAYSKLGEYRHAIDHYQEALTLARELGHRAGESISLNNIGTAYSDLGEYQEALDKHTESLEISRSLANRRAMAAALHNIGADYDWLGDYTHALPSYRQAMEIRRADGDLYLLGNTLNNIGITYANLGSHREALETFLEALSLRRQVGNVDGEGFTLANIGKSYEKLGEHEKARENLLQAARILRKTGHRDNLLVALRVLGMVERSAGDFALAAEYLDESLAIARDIQARHDEAAALAEMTRLEHCRGDHSRAAALADDALAVFDQIRQTVKSPKLRATLVAAVHDVQEIRIESLMQLHERQPGLGFDSAALRESERRRALSLLELIGEAGAEIRSGVDPQWISRERELQQSISAKAALQTRRLSGKHESAEAAAAAREIDAMALELDQLQSRIRKHSPRYAAWTHPQPLALNEIQSKVLDDETVLLEYALGSRRSYLFAVTTHSLDVYTLPEKGTIEPACRQLYDLLTARDQKPPQEAPAARAARIRQADEAWAAAAQRIGRMLLTPARGAIGHRRLLVVTEGVLSYVPFGALPDPESGEPLMVGHEVVTAPSASVVAAVREEIAGRPAPAKTIAVFADPVFSAVDARVATPAPATRSAPDFARLRFSRAEADNIARLVAPGRMLKAVDFVATRELAMQPELKDYRILHFATHSVLDDEHPELSGVVLSLADRKGQPQNGYLRLYDIYNLRLNADLVVLSACRTALGREIHGEGLIGLTRGFLYAGAPSVLATLWEIDDRTTAEVMTRFYDGLLGRGERPAAALRAALIALWRLKGWQAPHYWAAFTLQGEWR